MTRHILFERAFTFPVGTAAAATQYPDWRYDRNVGAWVSITDGELMVAEATNPNPKPKPTPTPPPPSPRPRPMSKKADVETGEDMKGE